MIKSQDFISQILGREKMNIKYKLQAILLISMFLISTVMADVFSKAQYTWPAGVIPYKLDSNIGKINRKAIEDGMKSYNRLTNITFVKVTRSNQSNYPHYVLFRETALLSSTGLYNLCDIGSPYGVGIRFAHIPSEGYMSQLETQHCLARVIGLHDEVKRSDRDDFVNVDKKTWKKMDGEIPYYLFTLTSGTFGYGVIAEKNAYTYGEYNYRGVLGFNDITEARFINEVPDRIVTIKEEMGIASDAYFDEKDGYFMKTFSQNSDTIDDLKGPFALLRTTGLLKEQVNPMQSAREIFTEEFMDRFDAENVSLSEKEQIALLQKLLNRHVGYDVQLLSSSARAQRGIPEQGKELLVIVEQKYTLLFRFFKEDGTYKDYTQNKNNIVSLNSAIEGYGWDDSRLFVQEKIALFHDAISATPYSYDTSNNIVNADLVWFNQQTVDAINSVYMKKANLASLPWSFEVGLYYQPCKKGYRGVSSLCMKFFRRPYFRGLGMLSARDLKTVKSYNRF